MIWNPFRLWWRVVAGVALLAVTLVFYNFRFHLQTTVDEPFPIAEVSCTDVSIPPRLLSVFNQLEALNTQVVLDGLALFHLVRDCRIPDQLTELDFSIRDVEFTHNVEHVLMRNNWHRLSRHGEPGSPGFDLKFQTPVGFIVNLRAETVWQGYTHYVPVYAKGKPPTRCKYTYKQVRTIQFQDGSVLAKSPLQEHLDSMFGAGWKEKETFAPPEMENWNCIVKNPVNKALDFGFPRAAAEWKTEYNCWGMAKTKVRGAVTQSPAGIALKKMVDHLSIAGIDYVVHGETHVRLYLDCVLSNDVSVVEVLVPQSALTKELQQWLKAMGWILSNKGRLEFSLKEQVDAVPVRLTPQVDSSGDWYAARVFLSDGKTPYWCPFSGKSTVWMNVGSLRVRAKFPFESVGLGTFGDAWRSDKLKLDPGFVKERCKPKLQTLLDSTTSNHAVKKLAYSCIGSHDAPSLQSSRHGQAFLQMSQDLKDAKVNFAAYAGTHLQLYRDCTLRTDSSDVDIVVPFHELTSEVIDFLKSRGWKDKGHRFGKIGTPGFEWGLVHSNGIRVDLFTEDRIDNDLYYTTVYNDGAWKPPARCLFRYSSTVDMDVNGVKVRARFPFDGIAKGLYGPNWKRRIKQKEWGEQNPYCVAFPYDLPGFIPKLLEPAESARDEFKCRGEWGVSEFHTSGVGVALQQMVEDLTFAGVDHALYGETHVRLLLDCSIADGRALLVVQSKSLSEAFLDFLSARKWKYIDSKTQGLLGKPGAQVVLQHTNGVQVVLVAEERRSNRVATTQSTCSYTYEKTVMMNVNGFFFRARFPFEAMPTALYGPEWESLKNIQKGAFPSPSCGEMIDWKET